MLSKTFYICLYFSFNVFKEVKKSTLVNYNCTTKHKTRPAQLSYLTMVYTATLIIYIISILFFSVAPSSLSKQHILNLLKVFRTVSLINVLASRMDTPSVSHVFTVNTWTGLKVNTWTDWHIYSWKSRLRWKQRKNIWHL